MAILDGNWQEQLQASGLACHQDKLEGRLHHVAHRVGDGIEPLLLGPLQADASGGVQGVD